MRISDWSSDVCSSDLRGQQTRLGVSSHPFDSPPRGKPRKSVPCSVAINQLRRMKMIPRTTICLWFDGTALEAATFYAETFPDSAVGPAHRPPGDFPSGQKGVEIGRAQHRNPATNTTIVLHPTRHSLHPSSPTRPPSYLCPPPLARPRTGARPEIPYPSA